MLPLAIRRRRRWDEPFAPMERFFDRMLRDWPPTMPEGDLTAAYPVDIREDNGKLVVDAEMPGFKRDEVDVSIDNGVLTITAERKAPETKGKPHLNERRYTRVERSFTLPTPVNESKIQASLKEGALHLELPYTEAHKPKRIEVK